ncbi:MAG TPA: PIN domain-containing protein [Gaiellaceae bacterium]|nr:PIN domain-containing protein [Gaiellaceae bacterium]
MIVLDAGGLIAGLVPTHPAHDAVRTFLQQEPGPFVLSPVILCEIDHLLLTRHGVAVEAEFLAEVSAGAYALAPFGTEETRMALEVILRYRDLNIGLADASIVVLAGRYRTNRVLTLDERHFRALRTPAGDPFVVLPADTGP